jgi:hypothetical protein
VEPLDIRGPETLQRHVAEVRVGVVLGALPDGVGLAGGPARRPGVDVALDELAHGDPTRRRGAAGGHLGDELGQLGVGLLSAALRIRRGRCG